MLARLIDPAPSRATELTAPPSVAPTRPASQGAGLGPRAIIPGDDPGDQQPPFAIETHITRTTTDVK